ncbi:MAG: choice-of-anchor D domain-containing protein [Syntrophothermus sp.]
MAQVLTPWKHLSLPAGQAHSVAIAPDGTIYTVIYGSGLFRSTDAGSSWLLLSSDIKDVYPNALIVNKSGNVYIGTMEGLVYRISADSTSITKIGDISYPVRSLLYSQNNTLFAAAGWLYYSKDEGATWDRNTSDSFRNIFLISETPHGQLAAGMPYSANRNLGSMLRSLDGGNSWSLDSNCSLWEIHAMATNKFGTMVRSGYPSTVSKSSESTRTWTEAGSLTSDDIYKYTRSIIAGPDGDFYYGSHYGLFHSSKDVTDFSRLAFKDTAVYSLAMDSAGVLFAANEAGLFRQSYLQASSFAINFPSTAMGDSNSVFLTLYNKRTDSSVTIAPSLSNTSSFYLSPALQLIIPPQDSIRLKIVYRPGSYNLSTATLSLSTTIDKLVIPLTGNSPLPEMKLSAGLIDFGETPKGTVKDSVLYLSNTSLSPLAIDSVSLSSSDFSIPPGIFPRILKQNETFNIHVTFRPQDRPNSEGFLKISSNAVPPVEMVRLVGNYAELAASPEAIDFISSDIGGSVSGIVYVSNPYRSTLHIDSAFTQTKFFSFDKNNLPETIAAKATVKLPLSFHPDKYGHFTDTLFISSSSKNSPLAIPLSGTGTVHGRIASLSLGNKWFYKDSTYDYNGSTGAETIKKSNTIKTIVGDSLINSVNYKIVEILQISEDKKIKKSFEFWYQDSLKFGSLGSFPDPSFKLNPFYFIEFQKDTSWTPYHSNDYISVHNDSTILFNRKVKTQTWGDSYVFPAGPQGSNSVLSAKGIGPVNYSSSINGRTGNYISSSKSILLGAFLDGVLLGDSISVPTSHVPESPGRIASLSLGNKWFYKDSTFYHKFIGGTSVDTIMKSNTTKTIVGDTLINSINYKIVESLQISSDNKVKKSYEYWHEDSLKFGSMGSFADPSFKLNPFYFVEFQKDTSWTPYFSDDHISVHNDSTILFNRKVKTQAWGDSYRRPTGPAGYSYVMSAQGIGPVSYLSSVDGRTGDYWLSSHSILLGAYLDGVMLGDSISVPADIAPESPKLSIAGDGNLVTLKWNKSREPDFLMYRIYKGSSVADMSVIDSITVVSDTVFVINELANSTTYYFGIDVVDKTGHISILSNSTYSTPLIPTSFRLAQNYPNPFNSETKITYDLPVDQNVKLLIFNVLGKEITTLVDEQQKAGRYTAVFKAANLPSGVYLFSIFTEKFTDTKKILLLK